MKVSKRNDSPSFDALIWDCDGCLIDSEAIACALSAGLLTAAGYNISTQDYITRFCGQSKKHIFSTILNETGIDYSGLFEETNKQQQQRDAFKKDLKAIDGIHDVLESIAIPMAIASGSEYDRLNYTLELTNLYNRFKGHIYSASLVKNGKPSPDIFLYAAEKLGVSPNRCLVIEDSINGVISGKAAGMTVFGFTGASHIFDKSAHARTLHEWGANLCFEKMLDLPRHMDAFTPST